MISISGEEFDPSSEHFSLGNYRQIGDMGELAKLRLFTNLKSASFSGSGLDDVGLRYVSGVPTIENLNLQDTRISNDGLVTLQSLPHLKHLRLKENPQLSNACIPHLIRLRQLVDLQIHETSIDQRGVNHLAEMDALRDLCLGVCEGNYTFAALSDLSRRMPRCRILAKGRGEFFRGEFDGVWTK